MMKTLRRLTQMTLFACLLLLLVTPRADAFGTKFVGNPKSETKPGERTAGHSDSEGGLDAEVTISDGPAPVTCVNRVGATPSATSEFETPVEPDIIITPTYEWRDVIGSDPPRQERVQNGTDLTIIRRWKVTTISCNGQPRTIRICVPGPGQPTTVCPPIKRPDGRSVALHNIKYVVWPDLNPQFAPDITKETEASFAITQAPLFYWFPAREYAKAPTAFAYACNDSGCITSTTQAQPIGTGFLPGVDGIELRCTTNGTPITAPSAYDEARNAKDCHQYTYRHSSTTAGGTYSAAVYIEYQIYIGSVDDADPNNSVPFALDPGNVYQSSVEFDLRVGEIEGVVR
jgi:hypothetical protein